MSFQRRLLKKRKKKLQNRASDVVVADTEISCKKRKLMEDVRKATRVADERYGITREAPKGSGSKNKSEKKKTKSKRRKSVRFSNVNVEHIIPNNEQLRRAEEMALRNELHDINNMVLEQGFRASNTDEVPLNQFIGGVGNLAYDGIDEAVESLAESIEALEAEAENDLNAAKEPKLKKKCKL